MAPEKKCLALPRVVQLCAPLLVLCQVLSAAPATVKDDTSLDLWRENKCTFPTQLVMNQVESNCNKLKIDTDYTYGTQTWYFITNVCQAILNISTNICHVPEETLEKNNLTEALINDYMGDDSVDVCGEDAGKAVTGLWAGLDRFVADDNTTCKVVLVEDDMGKMLRLLYHLNLARKKLPRSSDVVWKSRFTAFRQSWDGMNCTFPPQWAMETDVSYTCEKPPKEKPESEPWIYQETLCTAFFNVANSVCIDPDLRQLSGGGDELKGLLDNEKFTVCDQADKVKSVSSDMVSDLSVFTANRNMCSHLCVDVKNVTRVCKLLYFAITVPRFQHLQRLLQPVLSGGTADSATHTATADGGTHHTTTADGGTHHTTTGDGGTHTTTADGGTHHTTTADGGTHHSTTADGGTHTTTADGGTHHTTTADGETSGTIPEDPDQNPVAPSLAGGLLSDSSGRFMVYIVIAICSVLLLYIVFYNRRRMLDCVLRRRESWQRHRDVEGEGGKYSPLDAAVEDFLSLDKAAVTKSKTHVY